MQSNTWRALTCLLACTACSDVTAIVGRLRVAPEDASSGSGGHEPAATDPSTLIDAGKRLATGDAGVLMRRPALAPPSRQKVWNIEAGSRDQFCGGRGGVLRNTSDCLSLERQLFAYGLCTCGDVRLQGESFSIDSFDSSQGVYAPGQAGAAIGVNGSLYPSAGAIELGGSLIVTGSDALSISGSSFVVRGDLSSNSALTVGSQSVRIVRDAWLRGDVRGPGPESIMVGGTAFVTPDVKGTEAVRGRVQSTKFELSPPCACDELLDVPAIVAMARAVADNDAAGVSRDSLRDRSDTTAIPLPCGRFVLSEVSIPIGTIALTVAERTALFVEGDVDIVGTFAIYLSPGAELDLFIAGDLKLQGSGAFGVETQPSALRMYVAGQVEVGPNFTLAAQLYAPQAAVSGLADDTYGAVFARSFAADGAKKLHYDRSILNTTATCASTGQACAACDECASGLACISGTCSACTTDSDCCAPFACTLGRCSPLFTP